MRKLIAKMFGDFITFKISIPLIFVIWVIALPAIAYADRIWLKQVSTKEYFITSAIEVLLIWIGYTIGINTKKNDKHK